MVHQKSVIVALVLVTIAIVSHATPIGGGWRARADQIQQDFRVWQRNETGSSNGNENEAGKDLDFFLEKASFKIV